MDGIDAFIRAFALFLVLTLNLLQVVIKLAARARLAVAPFIRHALDEFLLESVALGCPFFSVYTRAKRVGPRRTCKQAGRQTGRQTDRQERKQMTACVFGETIAGAPPLLARPPARPSVTSSPIVISS